MISEVAQVMNILNAGGIPAIRAYPGQPIQAMTKPQAAVSIAQVDTQQVQVQVSVLSPAGLGGPACEDAAVKIGNLLKRLGTVCIDGPCGYDARCDMFCMELIISFTTQTAQ